MKIGLSYNLKSDFQDLTSGQTQPEDAFEEFDSPETIDEICNVINMLGHQCVKLGYGEPAIQKLKEERVDFVFNIAEGFKGRYREAAMPSLFDLLNVPYSGPDPATAVSTLDKIAAKKIAADIRIPTPPFAVIRDPHNFDYKSITYPAILKPACEGSSKGIRINSKVADPEQAEEKALWLNKNYPDQPVLAEEFIGGREITVAVIGNGSPEILGIMEIRPRKMPLDEFIYSLEVKRDYQNMVDYICPAALDDNLKEKIENAALKLHRGLGCRDISRFDFRISLQNIHYFLECNPLPGLNPISSDIVIMSRLLGIEYKELIGLILSAAFKRYSINHDHI